MIVRMQRQSGILMHISSLPSPYGIGDFGMESFSDKDLNTESSTDAVLSKNLANQPSLNEFLLKFANSILS